VCFRPYGRPLGSCRKISGVASRVPSASRPMGISAGWLRPDQGFLPPFNRDALAHYVETAKASLSLTIDRSFSRLPQD
jgi:hypothetical protein